MTVLVECLRVLLESLIFININLVNVNNLLHKLHFHLIISLYINGFPPLLFNRLLHYVGDLFLIQTHVQLQRWVLWSFLPISTVSSVFSDVEYRELRLDTLILVPTGQLACFDANGYVSFLETSVNHL